MSGAEGLGFRAGKAQAHAWRPESVHVSGWVCHCTMHHVCNEHGGNPMFALSPRSKPGPSVGLTHARGPRVETWHGNEITKAISADLVLCVAKDGACAGPVVL